MNGAEQEAFYQKRAPTDLPSWLRTVTLSFPSGRTAEELVVDDAAGLAWVVNLGCIELHRHPVRSADLEHPDELRIDLDPGPGVTWADIRTVALEVRAFLDDVGLRGWPKTSGSRGMHINVRIEPRWTFTEVRRAALALSRAIEKRVPALATSKWWKEERHGVFLDYNQNAKDRTTCSAYSVRPVPDARVSTPLAWSEVPTATLPNSPCSQFQNGSQKSEIRTQTWMRPSAHWTNYSNWPARMRKRVLATLPGLLTFARQIAKASALRRHAPNLSPKPSRTKMPLLVIANSPDKSAALAGLERWKSKHPETAKHLAADDVLVDSMRGRSSTWTRVRVNLRNVPEALRPAEEAPDPDDDPTREWRRCMIEATR